MSPEIQEWLHKSRSKINNLYLLTRPISLLDEKKLKLLLPAANAERYKRTFSVASRWRRKRYGRWRRHTNPMKFGQLILRRIIKIVVTRCHQVSDFKVKMHQNRFGSAADPTGGAYSAPPDTLAGIKGTYF